MATSVDGEISLNAAYHGFVCDVSSQIPFIVWLIENPSSPLSLPGSIDLQGHDYIHILLNREKSLADEAFVIGFTMGNCDKVCQHHLNIYKWLSRFLFPKVYRFNRFHLRHFDDGVQLGQQLSHKNIHLFQFELYADRPVAEIRQILDLESCEYDASSR